MRKGKFFGLFLFLIFAFVLSACSRESAPKAEGPEGVQLTLDKYPFYEKGKMTDGQIKNLGLARRKLDAPLAVFNYYRGLGGKGGWQAETLPVGTEVAVDNNGRPWYKIDCSNRLYVPGDVATAGSGGAGRRQGFPWLLLLPFAAIPIIWFLVKKLSGADAPGSRSHSAAGHTKPGVTGVIGPPRSDKTEPEPSVSPEAYEKNQLSVVPPLSSPDNAEPTVPIVVPVIATGKTAEAEKAQPTKTATGQKNTQTADDTAAAQSTQPTATGAATVPAASMTVGAAINILAGHGFKTVRDIETSPNGDVSFSATVKGGG